MPEEEKRPARVWLKKTGKLSRDENGVIVASLAVVEAVDALTESVYRLIGEVHVH